MSDDTMVTVGGAKFYDAKSVTITIGGREIPYIGTTVDADRLLGRGSDMAQIAQSAIHHLSRERVSVVGRVVGHVEFVTISASFAPNDYDTRRRAELGLPAEATAAQVQGAYERRDFAERILSDLAAEQRSPITADELRARLLLHPVRRRSRWDGSHAMMVPCIPEPLPLP